MEAERNKTKSEPFMTMRGITKIFPNVIANDKVDFDLYKGEVHALLGENGAGKSTLVKILYGFYQPDAGEIRFQGQIVEIKSPQDARDLRIGMVFQDFTLIPAMSVVENIALFLPDLQAVIDEKHIAQRIEEIAERYHLHVDPWTPVWQLSVGEQQKVEVLKLLLADAQVLILDEPTKVLVPHEVNGLFDVFNELKADGYAIVFITHKLPEVLTCADQITVMRNGSVAGTLIGAESNESRLVNLMFGADPPPQVDHHQKTVNVEEEPLLELKQVHTQAEGMTTSLSGIDLAVRAGEIVGVAGVSGNGQKVLGDVILGLTNSANGTKYLFGENATNWSAAKVRASGVGFIPENPLVMAAIPMMSVLENMAIADTKRHEKWKGLAIDWEGVRDDTGKYFENIGLKLPPLDLPIGTLSGGNLQRAIVARELGRNPRLVIALYPTKGLDVHSATAVRSELIKARNSGRGVLLISEDLSDLFSLCDRLVVLHRGKIVGSFDPEETNTNEVGHLMTGSSI